MTAKLNLNNKIINGAFDFWQRGTSFASAVGNSYHADRWIYTKTGTMVHTVSQSSGVPTDAFGTFSALLTPTTLQSVLGASDVTSIAQRIEGNILRTFKSKKMVLKFRVRAFKTGVYSVSLRNNAQDRVLIKEYTVLASNVWETKTIRFTHDASGTWLYDAGIGMRVNFTIAAGASLRTTPDTWQTGNFMASNSQVNGVDSLSNTFRIADVVLIEDNEGQTREPDFMYAGRDYFEELQLCLRYFEKSYDVGTAPGTGNVGGPVANLANASGAWECQIRFQLQKRATPTMVSYSTTTGAINTLRDESAGSDRAMGFTGIGTTGVRAQNGAVHTASGRASLQWTADAEL